MPNLEALFYYPLTGRSPHLIGCEEGRSVGHLVGSGLAMSSSGLLFLLLLSLKMEIESNKKVCSSLLVETKLHLTTFIR